MTSRDTQLILAKLGTAALRATAVAAIALGLSACRPGDEAVGHVAGWTLIDPAQRHPIIVSEQPTHMTVKVARGAAGLTPHQRSHVIDFLNRHRGADAGNGRLTVSVPTGSRNEVAALHAAGDVKQLISEYGLDETRVSIQPYRADGESHPPIRVSYARFIAEGPHCGQWPTNLAEEPRNLPYPNLGCATQRNLAAQIANPADLLGPRTMTPAASERRDVIWDKFIKGETTVTKKDAEEKATVKGSQ